MNIEQRIKILNKGRLVCPEKSTKKIQQEV